MKPTLSLPLSWLALLLPVNLLLADGAGSLDASFSNSGISLSSSPTGNVPYSIGIQSDGKIVVGGSHWSYLRSRPSSIRLMPDGTRDTKYGEIGFSTSESWVDTGSRVPMLMLPDGGFVMGSHRDTQFVVARYRSDGRVYTTFGSSGMFRRVAPCDAPGDLIPTVTTCLALHPPWNRIVTLVRPTEGNVFSMGLLYPEGGLVTNFGTNGWVTSSLGTGSGDREQIAVMNDAGILIGRITPTLSSPNRKKLALMKVTPSGAPDRYFYSSAREGIHDFGTMNADLVSLKSLPDGRSLAAGTLNGDFFVLRITKSGAPDFTFGKKGLVTAGLGSNFRAADMALQADGKILVAGSSIAEGAADGDFTVVRFLANGVLDTAFGHGGKVIVHRPITVDRANAVAVQPDGKILLAGTSGTELAVVRLQGQGLVDYDSWSAASGLEPTKRAKGAEPWGDGTNNLMKFAFNLDASRPDVHRMAPGDGDLGPPFGPDDRSAKRPDLPDRVSPAEKFRFDLRPSRLPKPPARILLGEKRSPHRAAGQRGLGPGDCRYAGGILGHSALRGGEHH